MLMYGQIVGTGVGCMLLASLAGTLEKSFGSYLLSTGISTRGGYSNTLPIRVCGAQRGSDFEAPDLERGIHFRGVF